MQELQTTEHRTEAEDRRAAEPEYFRDQSLRRAEQESLQALTHRESADRLRTVARIHQQALELKDDGFAV